MKRLISVIMLAGAFCFGTALPVVAQDKAADKPAAEAPKADEKKDAAPAPAAAAPAAAPSATAAPAPTPNKGDTAWMLTST
ncbi:MAG: ammonium transporter, partial [Burkholderiales bacterium]